jgi:hypothetical protein
MARNLNNVNIIFLVSMIITLYLTFCHLGCQEMNSKHVLANKSLKLLKSLCPHSNFIKYSKLCSCSLFIMILTFFILLLKKIYI